MTGWLRKNKAFTLIESCVVLALIVGLTWFPIQRYQRFQAQQAERLFFQEFETTWQSMRQYVATEPDSVVITMYPQGRRIEFSVTRQQQYNCQIEIPKTLKLTVEQWQGLILKQDYGVNPRTLTFKSTINQRRYDYKIQMMWGMLHV
ncbi:hypothetical protein [Latilactobacillus fuchuensis]|uniref:Prepilin-type N-terminal cleavage/methylation domain-containing protein n=1 Tax=Latilactobacillus fuchuensis TaxID=164393 RepID=A0A2N9DWC6_9LACO|nr:hypothetical protein [Latilactobacillus fuchuensis]SPC39007.1 conserved hypothetical protein [Latilactobacillus fuchuensis]